MSDPDAMSDSDAGPQVNVRSSGYLVAHTVAGCQRCGQPTGLVSMGLGPGHERLVDDAWVIVDASALIFQVEHLSPQVAGLLQGLLPQFRIANGSEGWGEYWLNHCRHCDAPQDDYWLYCEPGAAFLPDGGLAGGPFDLVQVSAPFAASAMGFAELPGDLPRAAGIG